MSKDLLDKYSPTRIVAGPGSLAQLGKLSKELGAARVLVVSDRGVASAGHTRRGLDSLESAGLEVDLYDGVEENPTTIHVGEGLERANAFRPDLMVGLGGGSAMDCAKGINFVYSCGGSMADYHGVGKATSKLLPMIGVPTTSGTGSETQSFALISDAATHEKMACGDKRAAFKAAILDPLTTVTQPLQVTAATGIDAISHAVESYVTRQRNDVSKKLSVEAWSLLSGNFQKVIESPEDVDARAAMQLGACLAGLAIEHSMLGAAHSAANPLTARYGVIHGVAVGLLLPGVVRFNSVACEDDYRELCGASSEGSESLASRLEEFRSLSGLPGRLSDCKVNKEDIPLMSLEATGQWTAQFNPREVTPVGFSEIYRAAY
ncbi:MAG: iron-containing alcohol dehydrogenase [Planctomycetes bacterium]|nr:iron-containing alcohol dehydrogenase [Planctomycetota bacterium]